MEGPPGELTYNQHSPTCLRDTHIYILVIAIPTLLDPRSSSQTKQQATPQVMMEYYIVTKDTGTNTIDTKLKSLALRANMPRSANTRMSQRNPSDRTY